MSSIVLTLHHLNTFLKGGSTDSLLRHLKRYDKRPEVLHKDLNVLTLGNPDIWEAVEDILYTLGIPPSAWGKYRKRKDTVSGFLQKLSQNGYLQVTYFIEKMEEKKLVTKMLIFFGVFYSAAVVAAILSTPYFASFVSFLFDFLSSELGIPVSGIVQAALTTAYSLYQTCSDGKQSILNRVRDTVFTLAKAAASFVGYALWISATVSMTWIIAGMFVASSILDLAREVFCLVQGEIQYWKNPPVVSDDPVVVNRGKVRHKVTYEQHRNAAIISLVSAILVIGLTAVLTFVPGTVAAICSFVALGLVYVATYLLQRKNEQYMRNRMQKTLAEIEQPTRPLENIEMSPLAALENSPAAAKTLQLSVGPTPGFLSNVRERMEPTASSLPFFISERLRKAERVPALGLSMTPG